MKDNTKIAIAAITGVTLVIIAIIASIVLIQTLKTETVEVPSKDAPYILEQDGVKVLCTWKSDRGWSDNSRWECNQIEA